MNRKKIGYRLFGLISSLYRIFPVKHNKTVFYMIHNDHKCGNLKFMYDALRKEKPDQTYIFLSKADLFQNNKVRGLLYFYVILNFHIMTAKEIYLNDNFLPLAYMPIKSSVKVIQLWHGVGAFKRFGLSTELNEEVRKIVKAGNEKLTHLFVSAKNVIPFYEEAFQVDQKKIYPVGLPVVDFYFNEVLRKEAKERFYHKYSELKGKKILLYTPTFRKTRGENKAILHSFSVNELKKRLGEEWAILMRLHPTISDSGILGELPPFVYDVTSYRDVKDLYEASDLLVNDYSSTVVEFALLKKPILFFAPDLEEYDRGFYREYRENVPGEVLQDFESLVTAIQKGTIEMEAIHRFLDLHYDYMDSNNCKRIIDRLSLR